MNYDTLRTQTNTGWNTWFSPSMTSHVLLPYGFCIHLCFKSCSEGKVLRNLKPDDHGLRPGNRSWDGSYTSLLFQAGETRITVESAARDGRQYLLITPEGDALRDLFFARFCRTAQRHFDALALQSAGIGRRLDAAVHHPQRPGVF